MLTPVTDLQVSWLLYDLKSLIILFCHHLQVICQLNYQFTEDFANIYPRYEFASKLYCFLCLIAYCYRRIEIHFKDHPYNWFYLAHEDSLEISNIKYEAAPSFRFSLINSNNLISEFSCYLFWILALDWIYHLIGTSFYLRDVMHFMS